MTPIQAASFFNVEATLNDWLATQLAAVTRPAWLATLPPIYHDGQPIVEPNVPCFSFFHIPVDVQLAAYQGRGAEIGRKAAPSMGMMDISAWATQAEPNYMAQLRTMRDMVATVTLLKVALVVKDFATSLTAPADTLYKVDFDNLTSTAPAPDTANPALWRARMLLDYRWNYRG